MGKRRAAARRIESAGEDAPRTEGTGHVASEHGVAVRPVAGTLLVFWTRDDSGNVAES